MRLYPKPKNRMAERPAITDEDRRISRLFDFDYFDGDRRHGYGGFSYHPRFWTETVDLITNHYGLPDGCSILTLVALKVSCSKTSRYDFQTRNWPASMYPPTRLSTLNKTSAFPSGTSADALPFDDGSFDLIISINTIHNLDREGCEHSRKSR